MHIFGNNIKIDFKDIVQDEVGWIHLPQDRDWCFDCEVPGSTQKKTDKI
jgi:hypothetical protein